MNTTLKLSQIVEEWMVDLDVLPATKTDYKRKILLWFRWLGTVVSNPRIPNRSHVLAYKRKLQADGKSIFTVNSYVTVVKLFYSWCETQEYYSSIGVGIKSSTKQKEHYKDPLTRQQSNKLLKSINTSTVVGKRDKLMIALMLTNGLRTCEISRINIQDISSEYGLTLLNLQRKGRVNKQEQLSIPPAVVELFEDYLSTRVIESGTEPLFLAHAFNSKDTRLSSTTISIIVKQRLRKIGIDNPKISAHSLRHTCASLMIEDGVPLEDVKDLLGHSNSKITRIYIESARKKKMLERSPSDRIAKMFLKPKRA